MDLDFVALAKVLERDMGLIAIPLKESAIVLGKIFVTGFMFTASKLWQVFQRIVAKLGFVFLAGLYEMSQMPQKYILGPLSIASQEAVYRSLQSFALWGDSIKLKFKNVVQA